MWNTPEPKKTLMCKIVGSAPLNDLFSMLQPLKGTVHSKIQIQSLSLNAHADRQPVGVVQSPNLNISAASLQNNVTTWLSYWQEVNKGWLRFNFWVNCSFNNHISYIFPLRWPASFKLLTPSNPFSKVVFCRYVRWRSQISIRRERTEGEKDQREGAVRVQRPVLMESHVLSLKHRLSVWFTQLMESQRFSGLWVEGDRGRADQRGWFRREIPAERFITRTIIRAHT